MPLELHAKPTRESGAQLFEEAHSPVGEARFSLPFSSAVRPLSLPVSRQGVRQIQSPVSHIVTREIYPYSFRVKTTIDLDEFKLMRLMDLTGIKTRREAIDYALTEAEQKASLTKPLEVKLTPEELADAVDPDYDLMAMRERGTSPTCLMHFGLIPASISNSKDPGLIPAKSPAHGQIKGSFTNAEWCGWSFCGDCGVKMCGSQWKSSAAHGHCHRPLRNAGECRGDSHRWVFRRNRRPALDARIATVAINEGTRSLADDF